jgi:hypothetical protein
MEDYLYFLIFVIILLLAYNYKINKSNKLELSNDSKYVATIPDVSEQFKNQKKKENFNPECSNIYGRYNPRCKENKNMYHIGYYNHNDQKYPILDMKNGKSKGKRFIWNLSDPVEENIKPFSQKYWDKIFYFKRPFRYEKKIPYSFIYNFLYVGRVRNSHFNKNFYIYEKKMSSNLYKYVLFEQTNGTFKHSFSLPDREKLTMGDVVFIRDKSSTLGPFIFTL